MGLFKSREEKAYEHDKKKIGRELKHIRKEEKTEYADAGRLLDHFDNNSTHDLEVAGEDGRRKVDQLLASLSQEVDDEEQFLRVATYHNQDQFKFRDKVRNADDWNTHLKWGEVVKETVGALRDAFSQKRAIIDAIRRAISTQPAATQKAVIVPTMRFFRELERDYFIVVRLLTRIEEWSSHRAFNEHIVSRLKNRVSSIKRKQEIMARRLQA